LPGRSSIQQIVSQQRKFAFGPSSSGAILASGYVVSRHLDQRLFDRYAVDVVSFQEDVHYHY